MPRIDTQPTIHSPDHVSAEELIGQDSTDSNSVGGAARGRKGSATPTENRIEPLAQAVEAERAWAEGNDRFAIIDRLERKLAAKLSEVPRGGGAELSLDVSGGVEVVGKGGVKLEAHRGEDGAYEIKAKGSYAVGVGLKDASVTAGAGGELTLRFLTPEGAADALVALSIDRATSGFSKLHPHFNERVSMAWDHLKSFGAELKLVDVEVKASAAVAQLGCRLSAGVTVSVDVEKRELTVSHGLEGGVFATLNAEALGLDGELKGGAKLQSTYRLSPVQLERLRSGELGVARLLVEVATSVETKVVASAELTAGGRLAVLSGKHKLSATVELPVEELFREGRAALLDAKWQLERRHAVSAATTGNFYFEAKVAEVSAGGDVFRKEKLSPMTLHDAVAWLKAEQAEREYLEASRAVAACR